MTTHPTDKNMQLRYFIFILSLFTLLTVSSFSQKNETIITKGEAQVEFPEYKSLLQVKKDAEESATINALEKAFGVMVIEGNSTFVKDVQSGKKSKTNTVFNSIGNQWVKGEVIEVLKKEFKKVDGVVLIDEKEKKITELKCTIKIRAREYKDNPVNYKMYTLNCLDVHCKTNIFIADKDDFHIYFYSPTSGYLAIFLDDGEQAQRLLPYKNMGSNFEQGVPVKANKEYFLFSNNEAYNYFEIDADEYVFESEQLLEQERLFVVFSKNPIVQPYIEKGNNSKQLSIVTDKAILHVPDALNSEEFQKWLIKSRINNRNIVVQIEDITIKK